MTKQIAHAHLDRILAGVADDLELALDRDDRGLVLLVIDRCRRLAKAV